MAGSWGVAPAVAFEDPNPSHSLKVRIYCNTGVPLDSEDGSAYGRIRHVPGSALIVDVSVEVAQNRP